MARARCSMILSFQRIFSCFYLHRFLKTSSYLPLPCGNKPYNNRFLGQNRNVDPWHINLYINWSNFLRQQYSFSIRYVKVKLHGATKIEMANIEDCKMCTNKREIDGIFSSNSIIRLPLPGSSVSTKPIAKTKTPAWSHPEYRPEAGSPMTPPRDNPRTKTSLHSVEKVWLQNLTPHQNPKRTKANPRISKTDLVDSFPKKITTHASRPAEKTLSRNSTQNTPPPPH